MRQFRFSGFFEAFFLSLCLSFGAVLCPITAFALPCDERLLFCGAAAASLLFALLFTLPRGWIGLLVLLPILGYGVFSFWQALCGALSLTANTIVPNFVQAFGMKQEYILFPAVSMGVDVLPFFLGLVVFLSLALCWAIRKLKSPLLCAVFSLPFLILCLIILETQPSPLAVCLVVGALALLILSQQVRQYDEVAGAKLSLVFSLPLAALLAALLLISPPDRYVRAKWPDRLLDRVTALAQEMTFLRKNEGTGQMEFVSPFTPSTLGAWSWDRSVESVDLSRLGPMRKTGRTVMQVKASGTGSVYLRADSMGSYKNNRWTAVDEADFEDRELETGYLPSRSAYGTSIQISTNMKSAICYVPYFTTDLPENMALHGDSYVENALQATEYTISYNASRGLGLDGYGAADAYSLYAEEQYLQLPERLRQALDEIDGIPRDPEELIRWIQKGKTYSLDTPKAPAGEDFVLWFLQDSSTGYCVHFATALTVLLRYTGTPARYVTGYLADAKAGEWADVTEDDAHAWVEYYEDGIGWQLLEATPADTGFSEESQGETNASTEENKKNQNNYTNINRESSKNAAENQRPNAEKRAAKPGVSEGKRTVNPGKALWRGLWIVLALCALWFAYRILVLTERKRRFTTGSINKRAVLLYRHTKRLSELAGREIPEELTALAEKARFSPYKLERAELQPLARLHEELTRELLKDTRFRKQFLYRMIYVIA